MSAAYDKLLDDWRQAAAETRRAQQVLKVRFDLFLQGCAPEPSEADIARMNALRDVESARLQAALASVRRIAAGRS
ncbi:hypothetical protein ACPWT1_00075 [Ramlibacter sp. MMS24-I3-19]|uniref:hypothetical protein n=1 Tax=Ramlibacter sp. MMS24-I3-19 TaxID=3416606 RepID=UPI003CFFA9B2